MKKDHRLMNQATHSTGIGQTGFSIALVILLLCLLHALWSFSLGWNNTLNDHFGFRQSQVAITAYYLQKEPFHLAYETPVLGKPWAWPMEFPIYQLIAAKISNATHMPLDQVGRAVTATFYLLTMIPIYALLRWRRVQPAFSLLFLCIFLVSPYYLFWARTFMIESSVLFFSFSYLACVMWSLESESLILLVCGAIFGAAAGLAKVTTWLPFLGFTGLWIIRDYLCWPIPIPSAKKLRQLVVSLVLGCGIPFLIAFWWVHYSDVVKALNPLGETLSSSKLGWWNYGTIDQKLSLQVWEVILSRFFMLFGLPLQAWIILISSMVAVIITRRRLWEFFALVGLFLISPAVFTNLHFVHDYYMNANGLFLLGAIGFAVMSLFESAVNRNKICGVVLLLFILWSGFSGVAAMYHPLQQMPNREILQVTDYIKEKTPKDSVLMILGSDYNPMISYYSERRTLMIPEWGWLNEDMVMKALRNLKGEKIGALLLAEPHRYSIEKLLQQCKAEGLEFPIIQSGQLPLR
jgi:hypothetical protein